MSPIIGRDIGQQTAEALGLDPTDLRSLQISIGPYNEIVTVTAVYMPTEAQVGDLLEIIKRYELVIRED